MPVERLRLHGGDWARYFAPVAVCGYLAMICVALIVTSLFLHNTGQTLAVSAAAAFGLMLTGAMGAGMLGMQLRELRYLSVSTQADAQQNFEQVLGLVQQLDWHTVVQEPGRRLEIRTADSMLQQGERVVVQFRGRQVLVACICDPGVGFSLVGRRRCQQHRQRVQDAVVSASP